MKLKSKVTVKGNKKEFVITVEDNLGYKGDLPVTLEEILELREILLKKF